MDKFDNFFIKISESWLNICLTTYGNMLNMAGKMTEMGKAHHDAIKKELDKDKS